MSHSENSMEYVVPAFDIPSIKDELLPGVFGRIDAVIDAHLAGFRQPYSPSTKAQVDFFSYLRDSVDVDAYTAIQRRFVNENSVFSATNPNKAADHLKYIHPVHWFKSKLGAALKLGLDKKPSMDILDIGTGCGHFPAVAQYLGHRVLGIDIPLRPLHPSQDTHFYNEVCRFYGVKKRDVRVDAFQPFEVPQKYDLVTAFMAAFNMMPDGSPYTIEAWQYFFRYLSEHILTQDGCVMMTLARNKVPDDVWAFLKGKSEWFNDKSMYIYFSDVEGVYR